MGDNWITDMTHFLDTLKPEPDVDIPGPARRLAEYLGKIVEAATSSPPLHLLETGIRCRRRPGRKPCVGHIRLVRNDGEGEIVWECTSCDDRGVIRGWEGTPWNRSLDDVDVDAPGFHDPTTFEPVEGHDYLMDAAVSEKNPSAVQLLGQVIKKMSKALDAYLDEVF